MRNGTATQSSGEKEAEGGQTLFHRRTLDSFDDATITRARPSHDGDGWYATLDVGPRRWPSDPDFSRYAATEAAAREACATAIRDDACGIGRFAPHSVLRDGYDLRFRLMRHWSDKEKERPIDVITA